MEDTEDKRNIVQELQATLRDMFNGTDYHKAQELLNSEAKEKAAYRRRAESAEKALDALKASSVELPRGRDGECIHVGDVVYIVGEDEPCKVASVNAIVDDEGVGHMVTVDREGDGTYCRFPNELTHKAPEPEDSWEKFEEDLALTPSDYARKHGVEFIPLSYEANAKRFAAHVAARARRLAEADRG